MGVLSGVNARLAVGSITVHPAHRGQGIGTALLDALLPELGSRGCETFETWGVTKDSAGEHWAVARGFQVVASRVRQRLTISEAALTTTVPGGYRVERWIGAAPEHLLSSVAATRQSIHDAPATASAAQLPEWTPEMVRAEEAEARAAGVEQRVVVAVEEATGRVVALTDVPLHPADTTDTNWGSTMVTPAHRGHGLGRVIQAHMLQWLRAERPTLERIDTSTDAANFAMIRVNEQLGFTTAKRTVVVSRSC